MPPKVPPWALRVLICVGVFISMAACQTTKPPPEYMLEMDSLAGSFGRLGDSMSLIGDRIIAMEKDRFQLTADSDETLSNEEGRRRIAELKRNIGVVRDELTAMAERFEILTNIPSSKDRNEEAVYEKHNEAMKALFLGLLGKGEDDEIKTTRDLGDIMVEIVLKDDKQEFTYAELKERGIVATPHAGELDRVGYLDLLEDYLELNLKKLNGLREVTFCDMERTDEKKYKCEISENRKLTEVLGKPVNTSRLANLPLWGRKTFRSMWQRLHYIKEGEIVGAMKNIIKYRMRITIFESKPSTS